MTRISLIPRNTWWNSLDDLEKFQDHISKVFNTHSPESCRNVGLLEGRWAPQIDVYDSHDNIMVKADIPGMNKEYIDVTIHGDILTIKGEKKTKDDVKGEEYIRSERFYGNFNRTLTLPSEVELDKVNATYNNGVLEVVFAKKEEVKPKRIEVNVK